MDHLLSSKATLVGVSAIFNEPTKLWGVSHLFELQEVHPTEGWSYVVSEEVTFCNQEQMITKMAIAYKNMTRVYQVTCNWANQEPYLCKPPIETNDRTQVNPMNQWSSTLRSHDIQVYVGSYHPKETEQSTVIVAGTPIGADILKAEFIPRMKANWIPGSTWINNRKD